MERVRQRTPVPQYVRFVLYNKQKNQPRSPILVEVPRVGLYYDRPFLRIAGHPTAFDSRSRCPAVIEDSRDRRNRCTMNPAPSIIRSVDRRQALGAHWFSQPSRNGPKALGRESDWTKDSQPLFGQSRALYNAAGCSCTGTVSRSTWDLSADRTFPQPAARTRGRKYRPKSG